MPAKKTEPNTNAEPQTFNDTFENPPVDQLAAEPNTNAEAQTFNDTFENPPVDQLAALEDKVNHLLNSREHKAYCEEHHG